MLSSSARNLMHVALVESLGQSALDKPKQTADSTELGSR